MDKSKNSIATREFDMAGVKLELPEAWDCESSGDGRYMFGTKTSRETLYVGIECLGFGEESSAENDSPSRRAEHYADEIIEFCQSLRLLTPVTIDRIQSGCVVAALDEYEDRGAWFRGYRWYTCLGRSDYVSRIRFMLSVKLPIANEHALEPLVTLIRDRAYALDIMARAVGDDDHVSLKDLTVDNLFTIRVPDWLRCEREVMPEGHSLWTCYSDRPGKLIIAYDFGELRPEFSGDHPEFLKRIADAYDPQDAPTERRRLGTARFKARFGEVIRIVDDEKARPYEAENFDRYHIRHHQWWYLLSDGQDGMMLFFNLIIPQRRLDEPAAKKLPALIEQEIMALRPLPPFDPIIP